MTDLLACACGHRKEIHDATPGARGQCFGCMGCDSYQPVNLVVSCPESDCHAEFGVPFAQQHSRQMARDIIVGHTAQEHPEAWAADRRARDHAREQGYAEQLRKEQRRRDECEANGHVGSGHSSARWTLKFGALVCDWCDGSVDVTKIPGAEITARGSVIVRAPQVGPQ